MFQFSGNSVFTEGTEKVRILHWIAFETSGTPTKYEGFSESCRMFNSKTPEGILDRPPGRDVRAITSRVIIYAEHLPFSRRVSEGDFTSTLDFSPCGTCDVLAPAGRQAESPIHINRERERLSLVDLRLRINP